MERFMVCGLRVMAVETRKPQNKSRAQVTYVHVLNLTSPATRRERGHLHHFYARVGLRDATGEIYIFTLQPMADLRPPVMPK